MTVSLSNIQSLLKKYKYKDFKVLCEMEKNKMKPSDIHKDHRKRVRARFIQEGNLDSFEYHQILELILFYAIPRRDTNELAHYLISEYGSFHELLNAKPEELMKRCSISESAAVLITMIPCIARRYLYSVWKSENSKVVTSLSTASECFTSLLAGKPFESFYMLCLDINKRLKKVVKISDGNHSSSPVYVENVVSSALLHSTSFVIIGHNHPSQTKKPSGSDVDITQNIKRALEPLGIKMLDHIIVCGEENYSFARHGLCSLRYDVN